MAATLTDTGELTFVSFPIEKTETTADGDLVVFGKCSDGSVDHDAQVVLPSFTAKATAAWLESGGNIRVQHNAQRDPAGIGISVEHDGDATWVKGLIIEPVAKKLVAKGALRAYSVGIARPTIQRDPTGKARGGIITDGEIVEISIVDRPANARCGISLVKAADDGTPEYVGKVFGGDDAIAKALSGETVTKGASGGGGNRTAMADAFAAALTPEDAGISFTPADLMKILKTKVIDEHYDDLALKAVTDAESAVYKRDIDTATRRRLAADGKALPNLSYPIENSGDLQNAATLARSGHGDVAAARRLIARRARELGVTNPLDESDSANKSATEVTVDVSGGLNLSAEQVKTLGEEVRAQIQQPAAEKEAEPDVTKDPESEDAEPQAKKAKKPKKPKKLPPWLNKPDDDGEGDDDGSCKMDHAHTEKCHTSPAEAAGVSASPMDPAPVGELLESSAPVSAKGATPQSASGASDSPPMKPVPAHREPDGAAAEEFERDAGMADGDKAVTAAPMMKSSPEVSALLRFRQIGIDPELGKLHDLCCPAYHPDDVAQYHPFADFRTLIDDGAWQRKALNAATGPLQHAIAMQDTLQAANLLKAADQADLNDWRLELHKAFRDANPGPGTYPSPGSISPQRYNRPLVTEGHEASSPGHMGPNMSPQVATTAPDAHSFDRPPLSAGHQSPSPSFMKASFEYPRETGVPTQLNYAMAEKERARQALVAMHAHLSRQFPEACPINWDGPQQAENHPVPEPAGIGKAEDSVEASLKHGEVIIPKSALVSVDAAFKATPEDEGHFEDAEVYKSFKKMRKKLGKKVLAGKITVDEARAHLGRQFAQKGAETAEKGDEALTAALVEQVRKGVMSIDEVRARFDANPPDLGGGASLVPAVPRGPAPAVPPVAAAFDPEVIKAAVAEATTDLRDLLIKQQETFTTKLAEQQKVIDAIADQPDPSTAAFSGLAFNPVRKSARPAGVTEIADHAERAQQAVIRHLEDQYNSSSDPVAREAYRATLYKMRGVVQ